MRFLLRVAQAIADFTVSALSSFTWLASTLVKHGKKYTDYIFGMSTERLIYSPIDGIRATLEQSGLQIVQQSNLQHSAARLSCCSLQSSPKLPTSFIPYKNIIWCSSEKLNPESIQEHSIENNGDSALGKIVKVTYIDPELSQKLPLTLNLFVELGPSANPLTKSVAESILDLAYKESKISPSILVIVNPHGGKGQAVSIYESKIAPIFKAAHVNVEYRETKYHQHAVEMARDLDITKYDIIVCCSGDGVPHEVINGFYQRPDKAEAFSKIAITQLPCGSGNALTLSSHGLNNASLATLSALKAQRVKADVMAVTQGEGTKATTKLSFLSQCYGIIADADIGTEHLRWMGPVRFDLGVAKGLLSRTKYPCDLYVKYVTEDKLQLQEHYNLHYNKDGKDDDTQEAVFELSGSTLEQEPPNDWDQVPSAITDNINIFYVGKMPYISNDVQFFPAALPNDGAMDMIVTHTNMPLAEAAGVLLSLDSGKHIRNENVLHSKIKAYRLVPRMNPHRHYISVDGEDFDFAPLQVEVLPRVMTTLLPEGRYIETSFNS